MKVWKQSDGMTLYNGDALECLQELSTESVQCIITSPPYYGLRSYLPEDAKGKTAEIGFGQTLDEYVDSLVVISRGLRRVLKPDGTFWLVIGDSYAGSGGPGDDYKSKINSKEALGAHAYKYKNANRKIDGLKPKNLCMIPARVALALQADGWWLRSDIIWHKTNCKPENVKDRPTNNYEHIFLLTKSARYYYDYKAIREPAKIGSDNSWSRKGKSKDHVLPGQVASEHRLARSGNKQKRSRNKRAVWTIPVARGGVGGHFAVFPSGLIEPCILAGSKPGDIILDPFAGSGTTMQVAIRHGRKAIGIELNPEYCSLISDRLSAIQRAIF